MKQYAYGLGLVFQIVDDVLDVTSTPEQLGREMIKRGVDVKGFNTAFAGDVPLGTRFLFRSYRRSYLLP